MSDELDKWISNAPLNIGNRKQIIEETIAQVGKDFTLQGVDIDLNNLVRSDLVHSFAEQLEKLEFLHNPKLAPVLYQLDLKESEISFRLTSSKPEAAYDMLSESILKRCFEKVMWRAIYKSTK